MTPDTESEFYVKEIKDMVNIVQRLLADGKWIHSLFMSSSGYRVNTVETE
jgi:hypothetical protein